MKMRLRILALIAGLAMFGACDEGTPTIVQELEAPAPPPVDLSTPYTLAAWQGEDVPRAAAGFVNAFGYNANIRSGSMKLQPDGSFLLRLRLADVSDDDFVTYWDATLSGQTFPIIGARHRFQYDAIQLSRGGVVLVAEPWQYVTDCLVFEDGAECADLTLYTRG